MKTLSSKIKRYLAMLLSVVMVFNSMPLSGFAAEEETAEDESIIVSEEEKSDDEGAIWVAGHKLDEANPYCEFSGGGLAWYECSNDSNTLVIQGDIFGDPVKFSDEENADTYMIYSSIPDTLTIVGKGGKLICDSAKYGIKAMAGAEVVGNLQIIGPEIAIAAGDAAGQCLSFGNNGSELVVSVRPYGGGETALAFEANSMKFSGNLQVESYANYTLLASAPGGVEFEEDCHIEYFYSSESDCIFELLKTGNESEQIAFPPVIVPEGATIQKQVRVDGTYYFVQLGGDKMGYATIGYDGGSDGPDGPDGPDNPNEPGVYVAGTKLTGSNSEVTFENEDGTGTARFNAQTNTLTLNGDFINTELCSFSFMNKPTTAIVSANISGKLKIAGEAVLENENAIFGIKTDADTDVEVIGDLTIKGTPKGILAGNLNIKGSVTASIRPDGNNNGVVLNAGKISISGKVDAESSAQHSTLVAADRGVTVEGSKASIHFKQTYNGNAERDFVVFMAMNEHDLTEHDLTEDVCLMDPEDGILKREYVGYDTYLYQVYASEEELASECTLLAEGLGIWIDGRQITRSNNPLSVENEGGKGKATFDIETNTLTLEGTFKNTELREVTDGECCIVYCNNTEDLTIEGKALLENESARYGIFAMAGADIKADLTINDVMCAIQVLQTKTNTLTISGSVKASLRPDTYGKSVVLASGKVIITGEVDASCNALFLLLAAGEYNDKITGKKAHVHLKTTADNGETCLFRIGTEAYAIPTDELRVTEPAGGRVSFRQMDDTHQGYYVYDSDYHRVKEFDLVYYRESFDIWIAGNELTHSNNPICLENKYGKGEAFFDEETDTLILSGNFINNEGDSTIISINREDPVTIKGKAVLDNTGLYNTGYGIDSDGFNNRGGDIIIDGDITVKAAIRSVSTKGDLTISGKLTSESGIDTELGALAASGKLLITGTLDMKVKAVDPQKYQLMVLLIAIKGIEISGDDAFVHIKDENEDSYFFMPYMQPLVLGENIRITDPKDGTVSVNEMYARQGFNIYKVVDAEGKPVKEVTIRKACTVNFNMSGKAATNIPEDQEVYNCGYATRPTTDPKAEGYTFAGWYEDSECTKEFDFANTKITKDTVIYAKWVEVTKDEENSKARADVAIDRYPTCWNLFEDAGVHVFAVNGVSADKAVKNSNAKSEAFYDATLEGGEIKVSLKADANRRNAAKAANTVLEFALADGSMIEFVLPVQYVKPTLKLEKRSAPILGKTVSTKVLKKASSGIFEPYDLTGIKVSYDKNEKAVVSVNAAGEVVINGAEKSKGKLVIKKDGWAEEIKLKFTVKAATDLYADLGGLKTVVVNKNAKEQTQEFNIFCTDTVSIKDTKKSGLVTVSGNKLIVAYKDGVKKGTYKIQLSVGNKSKQTIKVKVSEKDLDNAVKVTLKSKYNAVTGQSMVLVPNFKEISGKIVAVSTNIASGYTVSVNAAGNIVADYHGAPLTGQLKMNNLKLEITLEGVSSKINTEVKKIKAKKTTPAVKVAAVSLAKGASASAYIVATYKDSAKMIHNITPTKVTVDKASNCEATVNEADCTQILVKNLTAGKGSVKLIVEFNGVKKKVTLRVKEAK